MCTLRAVNCGAALPTEALNLMAQTHNRCVCVCLCARARVYVRACVRARERKREASVVTLRFATAVNNNPELKNENAVRIRRVIFHFPSKRSATNNISIGTDLSDCVLTPQLSSQCQSFIISVCWPQSDSSVPSIPYSYWSLISANHRRQYGYVSPL